MAPLIDIYKNDSLRNISCLSKRNLVSIFSQGKHDYLYTTLKSFDALLVPWLFDTTLTVAIQNF